MRGDSEWGPARSRRPAAPLRAARCRLARAAGQSGTRAPRALRRANWGVRSSALLAPPLPGGEAIQRLQRRQRVQVQAIELLEQRVRQRASEQSEEEIGRAHV